MPAPIGNPAYHVLIIPSEEFLPEGNHLSGIFQYHQALALRDAGHRVGILSVTQAYSIPMFARALLLRSIGKPARNELDSMPAREIVRLGFRKLTRAPEFVDVTAVDGIPVVRVEGFFYLPPSPATNHFGWERAGRIAFDEYSRRFGKPDVVHAHNLQPAGLLAEWLQRSAGVPFVVTEHSSYFRRNLIPRSLYPRMRKAANAAKALVTVSPSLGATIASDLGLGATQTVCIPNTLGPEFLSPPVLNENPGEFVFLSIGSLIPVKSHRTLIEAFARAFRGRTGVTLRIAGDGELEEPLKRLVSELDLAGQVEFTGRLSSAGVAAELDRCQVFVLPSLVETFGVVLIEALSRGVPVISTRSGGPDSIVTPDDGVLVPPADVEALSNAMTSLSSRRAEFSSERIRERALRRFGPGEVAAQLTQLYAQALGR